MDPTPDNLCPGCFAEKGRTHPCPHCGYDETVERSPLVLPHHTLLHGQYLVGRVLGKPGGFGITYLGWDLHLRTRVAIKEFLPRDLAGRATNRATVAAHTGDDGEQFRYGLEQFLGEARTLAQLDHPNIVRVRHFFEANGTAYLVMDYYQGLSLAEYLEQQGGRIAEEPARQLMLPILDGLRAVHAKGFLHRDIKPQNIYLARLDSGGVRPILLDFGAARQAMGERSRSLSVVVSAGYAPFEQYHRKGKQGPWTDVYAAAAVLYRMVTGAAPPDANERMVEDDLKPAAEYGVTRALSDALAKALALAPEGRPQTVQALQTQLWPAAAATTPPVPPTSRISSPEEVTEPRAPTPQPPEMAGAPSKSGTLTWVVVGLAAVAAAGSGGYWLVWQAAQVAPINAPQMVSLPAGSFTMGSPATELGRLLGGGEAEGPQHPVQVAAFELGKTEVTRAQFRDFTEATGYRTEAERNAGGQEGCWPRLMSNASEGHHLGKHWRDPGIPQGDNDPVVCVSWNDAQAYIKWLNGPTGRGYRLPSEAEWEYAARAGTTTPFNTGNCITTRQANYNGDTFDHCGAETGVAVGKTQPVGSYPANPWGLYDMYGNAFEYVEDCYHNNYNGAPVDGSTWGQETCQWRVVRGGAWDSEISFLRSAFRIEIEPASRFGEIGFRVARTLTP